MESKYIKLNSDDATESKKQLLESEMFLLNSLRFFNAYKKYRKKEIILKTNLKMTLRKITSEINKTISEMPETEKKPEKFVQEVSPEEIVFSNKKGRKDKIEMELDEIKRRLAEIG